LLLWRFYWLIVSRWPVRAAALSKLVNALKIPAARAANAPAKVIAVLEVSVNAQKAIAAVNATVSVRIRGRGKLLPLIISGRRDEKNITGAD
jgi:hypothetical protein